MAENAADRPASHFFGRRKGKALRQRQSSLIENLLPRLRVDPARLAIDPHGGFGSCDDLWLEIGFGGGEHLVADAIQYPGVCFIGCEPFVNGVAKLLAAMDERGLSNIRIYDADALDVLDALPPESLGRVNILYPDPWPKVRQRKRRIISPESVRLIARALKPGSDFRFATDIDDYSAWTLARVTSSGLFDWNAAKSDDWTRPWDDWKSTRYEAKALREGRTPAYLTFIRNSRPTA